MNKLLAATVVALVPLLVNAEPAKPSPSPSPAARTPAGPATYDSFRLLHTRNVFDPDRRPIRPAGNTPVTTAPTQADYAALTGTMISPEKTYAFFSGSRPEFNKVLSVRDQFANATIVNIGGQAIEIERDGKRTTVLVGQTVPFNNQTAPGDPPVDSSPADAATAVSAPVADGASPGANRPATGAASSYRPATPGGAPAASKGAPANLEEIRRRMMEKRQQELK